MRIRHIIVVGKRIILLPGVGPPMAIASGTTRSGCEPVAAAYQALCFFPHNPFSKGLQPRRAVLAAPRHLPFSLSTALTRPEDGCAPWPWIVNGIGGVVDHRSERGRGQRRPHLKSIALAGLNCAPSIQMADTGKPPIVRHGAHPIGAPRGGRILSWRSGADLRSGPPECRVNRSIVSTWMAS